tara:strand:- start:374 stop:673 length:300 start_codon:yes stop_codon:yes gene_type:complete
MADKTVKVIALTTTQQLLISEIQEVAAVDIGQPDCKLINPFVITTSDQKITLEEGVLVLAPWLLNITRDDIFMISSDKILTLCEPTPTLLEKYLDLTEE